MKALLVATTAICLCTASARAEDLSIPKLQKDICDVWDNTWNTEGSAAVGKYFAPDANFIPLVGVDVAGRDAITKTFADIGKNSTHKCVVEKAGSLGGNVIWIIGTATVTGPQPAHVRWGATDRLLPDGGFQIQMLVAPAIAEQPKQ